MDDINTPQDVEAEHWTLEDIMSAIAGIHDRLARMEAKVDKLTPLAEALEGFAGLMSSGQSAGINMLVPGLSLKD